MSASEVSPNPFWYAKLTAAVTSRDRLSICVLAMFTHKSVNQLSMAGIGEICQASGLLPPLTHWTVMRRDRVRILLPQMRFSHVALLSSCHAFHINRDPFGQPIMIIVNARQRQVSHFVDHHP